VLQIDLSHRFDSRGGLLNFEEQLLTRIFRREHQEVAIVPSDPFCRKPPKIAAQSEDVLVLKCLWQADKLKSQHQVVSPQENLQRWSKLDTIRSPEAGRLPSLPTLPFSRKPSTDTWLCEGLWFWSPKRFRNGFSRLQSFDRL
jgi:hypothetical protein